MKKAVILLSGGLDSATCLALAKSQGYECHAISFNYGQRSLSEIEAAKTVCKQLGIKDHKIVNLNIGEFGGSALTDQTIDVPEANQKSDADNEIPTTYVPARNTVFLSIALGYAEVINAFDIFYGANILDYSGYPDCRPEFLKAFQDLANVATKKGVNGEQFTIHAPLMDLHKHEIIKLGLELGLDYFQTQSCYQTDSEGNACGKCESCQIRREGFKIAGIADQTHYS